MDCGSFANDLLCGAFALMLVFEGVVPFVSPGLWRRALERTLAMTDAQIRLLGLAGLAVGAGLLLFITP
ncbi:MAG: DUF2065 domain-containing protein [Burkholderiaceae bacterium]